MSRTLTTFVAAAFLAAASGIAPFAIAQPFTPDFGDDASVWANDGECDDGRFAGAGMTTTPLLDDDIGHDASDCRSAWNAGNLRLADPKPFGRTNAPDFGDDASEWAFDDECDDPRFVGPGMTTTTLLDEDMYHDATDCEAAWDAGNIELRDSTSESAIESEA